MLVQALHQAGEAKEGAPITVAADHAAQITFQSYFRLYTKLSGMTGTAKQNYWEIRRVDKNDPSGADRLLTVELKLGEPPPQLKKKEGEKGRQGEGETKK